MRIKASVGLLIMLIFLISEGLLQAQTEAKLHLESNSIFDYPLWITSNNGLIRTNNWGHFHIRNTNGSTTNFWHVGHRDDNSFDIAYGQEMSHVVNKSNAKLSILPNGFVGIGTSSPTSNLQVEGKGLFNGTANGLTAYTTARSHTTNSARAIHGYATFDDNQAIKHGISATVSGNGLLHYGVDATVSGNATNYGVRGHTLGDNNTTGYGVYGDAEGSSTTKYGVYGVARGNSGTKYGVYGTVSGSGTSYAGYFDGNVFTTGSYLPSDIKLKTQIKLANSSLEKIKQLEVKTYLYDASLDHEINLAKGVQTGLLAQDVEIIFPELIKKGEPSYIKYR